MGCSASILPFLILIVAGVQAASVLGANRAAKFNADEQAMLSGPLAGLGRAQARRLIDQGIWMDGRAGDVLIREGEPAAQLYYLAERRRRRPFARQSGRPRRSRASWSAKRRCSARRRRSPP